MRILFIFRASDNQFLAYFDLTGQRTNLKEGSHFEIELVSAPGDETTTNDQSDNHKNDQPDDPKRRC
jgi:hypothetical protein